LNAHLVLITFKFDAWGKKSTLFVLCFGFWVSNYWELWIHLIKLKVHLFPTLANIVLEGLTYVNHPLLSQWWLMECHKLRFVSKGWWAHKFALQGFRILKGSRMKSNISCTTYLLPLLSFIPTWALISIMLGHVCHLCFITPLHFALALHSNQRLGILNYHF
jgi:hypothetical protein